MIHPDQSAAGQFTFAVRPGYETKTLLIEFRQGAGTDEMMDALDGVLKKLDAEKTNEEDLWMNDEKLYHMTSPFGPFELSHDTVYDNVFILADTNQPAIPIIAVALIVSGRFQKEDVDPADYMQ